MTVYYFKNIEDSEVAYYYNPTDSEIQEIDKYRILIESLIDLRLN